MNEHVKVYPPTPRLMLKLALSFTFGLVHSVVVTFSVAGDLDGKELDPGGCNNKGGKDWSPGSVRTTRLILLNIQHNLTKYGVLLGVVFLTVQTQQSAVVKVLHQALELVTERTPPLHTNR